LAPLPPEAEELVERIPPAKPPQQPPVGSAPHRLNEAPPLADPIAMTGDPAVRVELRPQELRPPDQAVAPEHQLAAREQRTEREPGVSPEVGEEHRPAIALEQEQLVGEHRQVVVVADGRGGNQVDLATRQPQ